MAERRFYWLKLREDFFRQKEIKKLRQIAGGDTYTIIYLKLLLRSLEAGGKLFYDGVEEDFPSEMALDIDEAVENVTMTVQFLIARGILQKNAEEEYEILTAAEMTGSESSSAHRMRDYRSRKMLQSDGTPSLCSSQVTERYTEIDIEKRDRDKKKSGDKADKPPRAMRFTPPSVEEVAAYCRERENNIDPERFVDFYTSKGWKVGNQKMRDWKAAVRNWERRPEYGAERNSGTGRDAVKTAEDYAKGDDFLS